MELVQDLIEKKPNDINYLTELLLILNWYWFRFLSLNALWVVMSVGSIVLIHALYCLYSPRATSVITKTVPERS